ncbi:MAG: PDZ domain-containing protein [Pseudohongiellaceae bacterium]
MPEKSRLMALLLSATLLTGCVSYEPAKLVPALNLSAENISLPAANSNGASIDFGVQLGLNESDSLSNIEILPGVRVRGVSTNGAADTAGIQPGDIILSIDGTLTNHPDVVTALQQQTAGAQSMLFVVRRNTVVLEATVIPRIISNNPAPRELYRVDPIASRAAYRTEMVNIRQESPMAAARVIDLFAQSPLTAAGIAPDDLILAVNSVALNSAQDLVSRLNTEFVLGETVTVTVYDGQSVTEKPLQLWDPGRRVSEVSLGPLLRYRSSLVPDTSSFSILDFWLFSLYSYNRVDEERTHSILGLIRFSSDLGELVEEEI